MARGKTTSKRVAKIASRVLRSKGSSKKSKTLAGSVLAQVTGRGPKRRRRR